MLSRHICGRCNNRFPNHVASRSRKCNIIFLACLLLAHLRYRDSMEARGLLVDHDEDFFPDIEAMALSYEGNNESKHLPVNQPVSSHRKAIVSLSLEEYGKIVKRRLPPINPRMQWSDFPRPQPPPQPQLPSKMPGPIQTAPHPDINKPSVSTVLLQLLRCFKSRDGRGKHKLRGRSPNPGTVAVLRTILVTNAHPPISRCVRAS